MTIQTHHCCIEEWRRIKGWKFTWQMRGLFLSSYWICIIGVFKFTACLCSSLVFIAAMVYISWQGLRGKPGDGNKLKKIFNKSFFSWVHILILQYNFVKVRTKWGAQQTGGQQGHRPWHDAQSCKIHTAAKIGTEWQGAREAWKNLWTSILFVAQRRSYLGAGQIELVVGICSHLTALLVSLSPGTLHCWTMRSLFSDR